MSTITIKRTGTLVHHDGKTGEISEADVDGLTIWAVERRDGYVSLDEGTYGIRMEFSPSIQGRRQFRVTDHQKKTLTGDVAAILIHAGNYPGDVAGCIAPGMVPTTDGVDKSQMAMEAIFAKFGGFEVGRTGQLVVTTKALEHVLDVSDALPQ